MNTAYEFKYSLELCYSLTPFNLSRLRYFTIKLYSNAWKCDTSIILLTCQLPNSLVYEKENINLLIIA